MKTVGLDVKEKIITEVKQSIKDSQGCFFINFNKVKASAVSQLRNNLRDCGAKVFVAKNSLLKLAFDQHAKDDLDGFLAQETAIVFVYDKDIVKTCKSLVDFTKENEALQLRGGFLKKDKITAEGLTALAKLPPKEVLLGMAVSAIASPLTGFVAALNQIVLKFVWVVEEIKKQKTVDRAQSTETNAQKTEESK